MKNDFPTRFTAGAFIAAAGMLWGGWMLLPVHLGVFFQPDVFASVYENFHLWVWMFRVHLFGMVVTAIALMALASQVAESPARVLIWPGAAVAAAGMIVGAVGAAFYYHHGAWGALDMHGKSAAEIARFVDALRIDTEYVTCLVRFGRVFSGLGLLVIGSGMIYGKLLPAWINRPAIAIGLAAMGVTMLLPDAMELYLPVFHVKCLWLMVTGGVILRRGLRMVD